MKALTNPNHLNSSWVPLQYELIFPDRVGQNYSLKFSEEHKWYYYPKMKKEECLVFKVGYVTKGADDITHLAA